jgi:membrane protease YdiL (CAAX protease family)
MAALRARAAHAMAGPALPPDEADLAQLRLFGLAFPRRASVAVLAMTALVTADQAGLFVPTDLPAGALLGLQPITFSRLFLFLIVPLGIVVIGFRDSPARYGFALGDWRWGVMLLGAGLLVMTPVILGLSALPQFRDYYDGAGVTPGAVPGSLILDHVAELLPAEFLLRGFLMFALWRVIGPLALVIALIPFVLTHVGKPPIELWSTFVGGSVFAWLDWRTGSILWSAVGHVYVLTLMEVAVGAARLG